MDKTYNLLIIDDMESNRYALSRMLKREGYDIVEAATAVEGMARAAEQPDLILLDVHLPDGNGKQICQQLKMTEATQHIPVVLTSAAFVEGKDKVEGLDSGADGYLTTPINPLELAATIRSLLRVRETEDKLRKSQQMFETLANTIPQLAWMTDAGGWIFWYNQRWYEYTGTVLEEMQGWGWQKVHHPEHVGRVTEKFKKAVQVQSEHWEDTFPLRGKDGEYRWFLSRAYPIRDHQGKVVRWFGTNTDISEMKRMEEALRQAYEQAEAANNAKSEFLTHMSHEIRTPMNAIMGIAQILDNTPLNEQQQKLVTTLQTSSDALLSLINDVLDIARIESSNLELEHEEFSLRSLIDEVMQMSAIRAQEKSLELRSVIEDGLKTYYMGDALRIRQVLINLISNALKFTEQGSVVLEVGQQQKKEGGRDCVTFRVTDTGIGIPQDKIYQIFEKFSQGDSSITRRYGGSGLGLTISKALVDRMGGNIHVTSSADKGSVFTVNLPLEAVTDKVTEVSTDDTTADTARTAEKGRVLLVEDHQPNILVATTLLQLFGYEYDIANDGNEAVSMVKKKPYDVVLMDVQMRDMDGLQATQMIRQWEQEQARQPIHIIAMTAHATLGYRDKCLAAGMNDFISKPFQPEELESKLRRMAY